MKNTKLFACIMFLSVFIAQYTFAEVMTGEGAVAVENTPVAESTPQPGLEIESSLGVTKIGGRIKLSIFDSARGVSSIVTGSKMTSNSGWMYNGVAFSWLSLLYRRN